MTLAIDNPNVSDPTRVANIDVVDQTTGTVRAVLAVPRWAFSAGGAFRQFVLNFNAVGNDAHEFRVWYDGVVPVRLADLTVR